MTNAFENILVRIIDYSSPPLSIEDTFQDPSGYLKPWIVLTPIYTHNFFLHIHTYDRV